MPPEAARPSVVPLIVQILLLLAGIAMTVFFLTRLPMQFTASYGTVGAPPHAASAAICSTSDMLSEADIPENSIPESNPVIVVDPTLPDYDFAAVVPESLAVSTDYFADTIFIGDSRTVGLIMYTKLKPIDFSAVGLNISTIWTKSYIRMQDASGKNKSYKLADALEMKQGEYKSIYLAVGLNELGWEPAGFASAFKRSISNLRAITNVPIYVQLIIPVTKTASETSQFGVTNEKAVLFNAEIRRLAEELELYLLDPTEIFMLDDGTLDPDVASDGIHLQPPAYTEILDYYRTHVVDAADWANLTRKYLSENSNQSTPGLVFKPENPDPVIHSANP